MSKRSRYLVEKLHSMTNRHGKAMGSTDSIASMDLEAPPDGVRMVFESPMSTEPSRGDAADDAKEDQCGDGEKMSPVDSIEDLGEEVEVEEEEEEEMGTAAEVEVEAQMTAEEPEVEVEVEVEAAAAAAEEEEDAEAEAEAAADEEEVDVEAEAEAAEEEAEAEAEAEAESINEVDEPPISETLEEESPEAADSSPAAAVVQEDTPPIQVDDEADLKEEDLPMAREVSSSLQDVFAAVRTVLEGMPPVDTDEEAAENERLKRLRKSEPVDIDMGWILDDFPGAPAEDVLKDAENFYKYYSSLTVDDGGQGEDIYAIEHAKRVVIYGSLRDILGTVPLSLVRMLLMLSAKTFVVAFYAIAEGCKFTRLLTKTIFKTCPGLGVDVTEVFDDYMLDFYNKGCDVLQLNADFRNHVAQDCVSFHDLLLLTNW